jgi:hypothetical protein
MVSTDLDGDSPVLLKEALQEIERNYRAIRAAEAEVRAERDRLDLVIDSVADPIIVKSSS